MRAFRLRNDVRYGRTTLPRTTRLPQRRGRGEARSRPRPARAACGSPAVVLNEPGPVAWLTGGVTNRIEPGSPASPLWLVVTRDGGRRGHDERRAAAARGRVGPGGARDRAARGAVARARRARARGRGARRRAARADRRPRRRRRRRPRRVAPHAVAARDGAALVARRRRRPGARERPPRVDAGRARLRRAGAQSPSSSSGPARSARA